MAKATVVGPLDSQPGAGIGEPKPFRFDTDHEIEPGDWLIEKSARTQCGERWWTVLKVRLMKPRGVLQRRFRYMLTVQERATPTEADPSIPEDFPTEPGMVFFFERHRR